LKIEGKNGMKKSSLKNPTRPAARKAGADKSNGTLKKVAAFLRELTSPPHFSDSAYASLAAAIREGETSWLM